jgi:hypothetical protein
MSLMTACCCMTYTRTGGCVVGSHAAMIHQHTSGVLWTSARTGVESNHILQGNGRT